MDRAEKIEEVLNLVALSRRQGWYADDLGWEEVDRLLDDLGYDIDQKAEIERYRSARLTQAPAANDGAR